MNNGHVAVVGPMSSGCRLLKRIINASPDLVCWLDTTHGSGELVENKIPIPMEAKVIVILRDKQATDKSREKNWNGKPEYIGYDESINGIKSKYSDALQIKYEDLCSNPKKEIERIAKYLGVPVWVYPGRVFKSRNLKWYK